MSEPVPDEWVETAARLMRPGVWHRDDDEVGPATHHVRRECRQSVAAVWPLVAQRVQAATNEAYTRGRRDLSVELLRMGDEAVTG